MPLLRGFFVWIWATAATLRFSASIGVPIGVAFAGLLWQI
jgi:hypothetical protein